MRNVCSLATLFDGRAHDFGGFVDADRQRGAVERLQKAGGDRIVGVDDRETFAA